MSGVESRCSRDKEMRGRSGGVFNGVINFLLNFSKSF